MSNTLTLSGHLMPLGFVVMLWFASTGLVAWLDNRSQASFGTTLSVAGALALLGLMTVFATAGSTDPRAAYAAFAAAFLIWGWHELAFLTGRVTGPRRTPCPPEARGWERFRLSAATVIHHELSLAATLVALALLSWQAANIVGVAAFAVLFAMRLSTKFNVFLGVPNFSTEMLPPQLSYLKSYFRTRPFNALMPVSLALGAAATWWFGARALAAEGDAAIGWSLLTGIALLGIMEHLFLVLPIRDGALWRWAVPLR